jgi:predicted XRE-type DNA-binding protein
MGLPDAEELQRKLRLGAAICNAVDRDKPTQAQVAALLGINQPEVSALLPFKLEGFSVERLMRFLLKLGHDAEIVLQAKPKSRAARIAVRAA